MMPLHVNGIIEVQHLRRRVRTLEGLGRIHAADADELAKLLDDFEGKVLSMHEIDDLGRELSSEDF